MDWRDLVGWRRLKKSRRERLARHNASAEHVFEAFESETDDPMVILNTLLEDLQGGRALMALQPAQLTAAKIASMAVLRTIAFTDERSRAYLNDPSTYVRHFAAERILDYGNAIETPYSAEDVALMFDLALTGGNLDRTLKKVQIRFGPEWHPFAGARLVDQILSEVRVPLFDTALSAAETLMPFEFSGDVADQLVRTREILGRVSPATFEINELLDRVEELLDRPLTGPE
jgi:hypothetical protein